MLGCAKKENPATVSQTPSARAASECGSIGTTVGGAQVFYITARWFECIGAPRKVSVAPIEIHTQNLVSVGAV
jgi:hypothetical protein